MDRAPVDTSFDAGQSYANLQPSQLLFLFLRLYFDFLS